VCDLETTKILVNEEAKAHQGAVAPKKNFKNSAIFSSKIKTTAPVAILKNGGFFS
jgi:hypothetical protein